MINTVHLSLLVQLERRYGHLLVGHTAGFITSSKSGLTESEIEDLLCLDDRVLGEVFSYQAGSIFRGAPSGQKKCHKILVFYVPWEIT